VVLRPQQTWQTATCRREDGEAHVLTKEKLRSGSRRPRRLQRRRWRCGFRSRFGFGRKQAEQKGLPYQTYIKSLLHETLTEREKRKGGW